VGQSAGGSDKASSVDLPNVSYRPELTAESKGSAPNRFSCLVHLKSFAHSGLVVHKSSATLLKLHLGESRRPSQRVANANQPKGAGKPSKRVPTFESMYQAKTSSDRPTSLNCPKRRGLPAFHDGGNRSISDTILLVPFGRVSRLISTWRVLFSGTAVASLVLVTPQFATGAGIFNENSPGSPGGLIATASQAPQLERGESQLWYPVASETLRPADRTWRIESSNYTILRLNRARLAALLARATLAATDEAKPGVVLDLPLPDGTFKSFRIGEASTAERRALRCPDLKTYRGRGVTETSTTVRFDWSSSGLNAIIYAGEIVAHIVPYSSSDTQHYIVYHARDWRPGPGRTDGPTGAGVSDRRPAVPAFSTQSPPTSVEEITIERNCFGCEYPYKLTLRNDGAATLMTIGVLRFATQDHACRGRVTREVFAGLAAFMRRDGFFNLNETYQSPFVDGSCAITSGIVGGQRKAVNHCNDAGPPNLKAIEDAIDALGKKVVWTDRRP
jgi:hypothetical protein